MMVKYRKILIFYVMFGNLLKSSASAGLLDGLGLVVNNQPISSASTNNNALGSALTGLTNGLANLLGSSRRVDTLNSNLVPINSGVVPIHSNIVPFHSNVVPMTTNIERNTVILPLNGNEYSNGNMIVYPIQTYPNGSPNTNSVSQFGNKIPVNYLNRQNYQNQINSKGSLNTKLAEAQRLYYDRIKELNRLKDLQKVQNLLNQGNDNKNNQEETTTPLEITTETSTTVTETSQKHREIDTQITTESSPVTTKDIKKEEKSTTLSTTTESISTTQNTVPLLKTLIKSKFYYQMVPVKPENERGRRNETVYYFD